MCPQTPLLLPKKKTDFLKEMKNEKLNVRLYALLVSNFLKIENNSNLYIKYKNAYRFILKM